MKTTVRAMMMGACLLAGYAAQADDTYIVDKVTILGSKTVPEDKLLAAISEHAGSRVAVSDIIADQDKITKVLGESHVVGGIKTAMAKKSNGHIEVIFTLDDQGAQAPVVTKVAPKLDKEIFVGNKSVDTDKLVAASGLKPGDELTNEKIGSAQQAIAQAYKDAKVRVNMSLSGSTQVVSPGMVDVTWTIVETKAKRKSSIGESGHELEPGSDDDQK